MVKRPIWHAIAWSADAAYLCIGLPSQHPDHIRFLQPHPTSQSSTIYIEVAVLKTASAKTHWSSMREAGELYVQYAWLGWLQNSHFAVQKHSYYSLENTWTAIPF